MIISIVSSLNSCLTPSISIELGNSGSEFVAPGKTRFGLFPSVSIGWVMSAEEFMNRQNVFTYLKLRASWGSLGNNAVGNYEWQSVFNKDSYILNNTLAPGLSIQTISNAGLTWETTYVTNVGVDFEFFNSKLEGTLDLFDKDTQNILIELPAPLLVGNAKVPTQNAARVNNKGVELSLKWRDRVGDFNYFISGNGSYVRNKVTKYKGMAHCHGEWHYQPSFTAYCFSGIHQRIVQ